MQKSTKDSWVLSTFWNTPDLCAIDECTQRKSARCVIVSVVFPFISHLAMEGGFDGHFSMEA
jgi:hypothetical protein